MTTTLDEYQLGHVTYVGTTIGGWDHDRMRHAIEHLIKNYPGHNVKVWMNARTLPVEPLEWTVRISGPTGCRNLLISQRRLHGTVLIKAQ